MNGFTENTTESSEKPERRDVIFTWSNARRMLPLVERIARDVLDLSRRLALIQPEKTRLDRQKRLLGWAERSRRYQLQEEINAGEKDLQAARAELAGLGLVLLDPAQGLIGFPTRVNDRRAFFSWQPGEYGLLYWHFADETVRRPIPTDWTKLADTRVLGKS